MGHYDDCYNAEYREAQLREKARLENFLKAFREFLNNSYRTAGAAPPSFIKQEVRLIEMRIQSRLYELEG